MREDQFIVWRWEISLWLTKINFGSVYLCMPHVDPWLLTKEINLLPSEDLVQDNLHIPTASGQVNEWISASSTWGPNMYDLGILRYATYMGKGEVEAVLSEAVWKTEASSIQRSEKLVSFTDHAQPLCHREIGLQMFFSMRVGVVICPFLELAEWFLFMPDFFQCTSWCKNCLTWHRHYKMWGNSWWRNFQDWASCARKVLLQGKGETDVNMYDIFCNCWDEKRAIAGFYTSEGSRME